MAPQSLSRKDKNVVPPKSHIQSGHSSPLPPGHQPASFFHTPAPSESPGQRREGAKHFLPHKPSLRAERSHPGGQEAKQLVAPPNSNSTELKALGWAYLWGPKGFSGLWSSPAPRPYLGRSPGTGKGSAPSHPICCPCHSTSSVAGSSAALLPRLRNLGWAGRSSEDPHLHTAITTPLSLHLNYKIITGL